MFHANRMLVDHANRRAEERAARAELLRQAAPAGPSPLRHLLAGLSRRRALRPLRNASDLEATSG